MNNELGRKITSLTLMTIMIAGGLTFAIPGVMPAAHAANANLFVSAENSQFDNYMGGPQVIEVVIIDSDINDTDEAKGEPDVTVNGNILRMVQAVDGNWYGYFADRDQAQTADSTVTTAGIGLDFGSFCASTSTPLGATVTFTDTDGIAVDDSALGAAGVSGGGAITAACSGTYAQDGSINVVREQKDVNTTPALNGQIGLTDATAWPFIQLYTFNPTGNVIVQYNKGGGTQTTTLTFDTVDGYAGLELDRSIYPNNAEVHATITDLWLNIDPTDEDSWSWATNATDTQGTFYQVFDENGNAPGDAAGTAGSQDISGVGGLLMLEDNGVLVLDVDAQDRGTDVVTIQDNEDSQITNTSSETASTAVSDGGRFAANSQPVTFTEQGPNSGVFGSYDELDTSALRITSGAARDVSASIDYNETPTTVRVGFGFAEIDILPPNDVWSSGEEIPVELLDSDANKNSRADEDLDLFNPAVTLIPSLTTGDTFTLGEAGFEGDTALQASTLTASIITQGTTAGLDTATGTVGATLSTSVDRFSLRAILGTSSATTTTLIVDTEATLGDVRDTINDARNITNESTFRGTNLLNIDLRSWTGAGSVDVYLVLNSTAATTPEILNDTDGTIVGTLNAISLVNDTSLQSLVSLNGSEIINTHLFNDTAGNDASAVGFLYEFTSAVPPTTASTPIVTDFFSFGFADDGNQAAERTASQILRLELEEDADNSANFVGTLEYIMVNQLNILDSDTYEISPISDEASFIVIEDLTDEDAPRVNYFDLGFDGVSTQVADQEEAPSHSGVVSLDADTYKIADTVTVELTDQDLNVNSDLIDIFTVVTVGTDPAVDAVGAAGLPTGVRDTASATGDAFSFGALGRLLDITFDDERWSAPTFANSDGISCADNAADFASAFNLGLGDTGFSLVETETTSGSFLGTFQIPDIYCQRSGADAASGVAVSVTGTDIEVNYVDFRDASGEIIEVGDSAGIRANTGSVSLDRTVYPVPWGELSDFGGTTGASTPAQDSVFPIHATGVAAGADTIVNVADDTLGNGDLTIHVRISDPDFDTSASGEDTIAQDVSAANPVGPLKITVSRGADNVVLAYAGGSTPISDGRIDVGDNNANNTRQLGGITEVKPDAAVFELDFGIRYTDGPASSQCPDTTSYSVLNSTISAASSSTDPLSRFDAAPSVGDYCILQGDIITVQYTDPTDASGDPNTVTDSATFDLRNGVLQSDKSVYIIGSDMILTIIEPDWDLDNDAAETYDLDIVEWDSDAATISMGDRAGAANAASFDPEPTDFRETGDSTGIFQIVIEVPQALSGDSLERGEEIILEYTDWGPSGADYVGQEDEDVNLTVFTSNFGATVELDQKVYSWTDKVYITVVAPDHNFDSDLIDEVGENPQDPIKISTRGNELDQYKLVETGTDTGIFTGEVILTGFLHDADGDASTGTADGFDTNPRTGNAAETATIGLGPTDGFLETDDDDGVTVSFEFSEDETVVGSALIRWNIGEVQWLEASYPASGTGVVRIVDPDMNLDPEAVDNFDVDVWSDSDAGGIDLTVTETNEATGIFEGTVFFTVSDESSGHRLRVSEGDTITAEYDDNTLPDPYTTADELDISATSLIGTIVPPLERAPATSLRVVDSFGNTLDNVTQDQQIQITADLANGQDKEQAFAYIVQVQDGNGVTVALAWISGSLDPAQSFSPSLSWTPDMPGTYTATAFVWESVDNPTALSPPTKSTITVN